MRTIVVSLAVLLLTGVPAGAVIFTLLDDEFDDSGRIREVRDRPEVQAARAKLDEYKRGLLRLKERDFVAMFGKAQPQPAKAYAMPVAQARGLALSGLRHGDPAMNKDHTDFYVVPGAGALEVYYQIDGESPAAIVVYLPVDSTFPRLTERNLAERLAWDADRVDRLEARTRARFELAFPWEVDRAELARLTAGDFETNAGRKLAAWVASGEALGYTCRHEPGSIEWKWYDNNGRLAREALCSPQAGGAATFNWYRATGDPLREEWFDHPTGELTARRWGGPGGNVRYETRGSWCWYDRAGKAARLEWDDNGDGIPDWYVAAADGLEHCADRRAMEKRRPLTVPASWAVHPELIPPESRVPDQPGLRVPVRRREAMAGRANAGPGGVALAAPLVVPADPMESGPPARDQVGAANRLIAIGWAVGAPGGALAVGLAAFVCVRRGRGPRAAAEPARAPDRGGN
jgi:hypothetical protein